MVFIESNKQSTLMTNPNINKLIDWNNKLLTYNLTLLIKYINSSKNNNINKVAWLVIFN